MEAYADDRLSRYYSMPFSELLYQQLCYTIYV